MEMVNEVWYGCLQVDVCVRRQQLKENVSSATVESGSESEDNEESVVVWSSQSTQETAPSEERNTATSPQVTHTHLCVLSYLPVTYHVPDMVYTFCSVLFPRYIR